MLRRYRIWMMGAAMVALMMGGTFAVRAAEAPTALEARFAELAKLPAEERMKQISEAAKKEGRMMMLPILQSRLGRDHTRMFEKRYPFLKVEYLDIGSDDMAERFLVEETSGKHLTDLVSLSLPDMYHIVTQNLTARYPTPAVENVLPVYNIFKHPEHLWVPAYWKEHGISYNAAMLPEAEAPKSWADLCKPSLRGMVSYDASHNAWLTGMYFVMGKDERKLEELFACIGGNDPILQNGHTSRLMLMLAGDHPIMGENALYAGTLANVKNPKKAPFKAVYTAEVLAYPAVMSISRKAAHPMAAALYADWVLTLESQEFLAKEYRSPITVPHPYMPPDAKIVNVGYVDNETADRIHAIWTKYTGKRG